MKIGFYGPLNLSLSITYFKFHVIYKTWMYMYMPKKNIMCISSPALLIKKKSIVMKLVLIQRGDSGS
jgi:hypothetical protein